MVYYFTVFRVHEYCFQAYIWTIVIQSCFPVYSQLKIHRFFSEIKSHASDSHQHLRTIKIKIKRLGISYHNHVFFHYYNYLNCSKLFWSFYCVDTKDTVFGWFHFSICVNYFLLLSLQRTVFPPFLLLLVLIGSPVNYLLGVRMFNPIHGFFFLFRGFNFTLSALVTSV